MPHRKGQFVNNEIYHIVLRAIDDNLLFKDIDDYYRGIFSIYEFNNINPVSISKRRKERQKEKLIEKFIQIEQKQDPLLTGSGQERVLFTADKREKIVEVLMFCLMPNHIHLLLKQIKEGGIIKFMMKLGAGYGRYFNKKHSRKGYVFQDRFKDVHIEDDDQLRNVFIYIHTNPVALLNPHWKQCGVKNPRKTIKFIEEYKWSSYQDYLGNKNFPSITNRKFLLEVMNGIKGCRNSVNDWIEYKGEMNKFSQIVLE